MSYKAVLSWAKLASHSYYVWISASKHTIPSFCHSRQLASKTGHVCKAKLTAITSSHVNVHAYVSLCMLLSACECIVCGFASQGSRIDIWSHTELNRMCIFAWNWRGGNSTNEKHDFSHACFCLNQHAKCRYGRKHITLWGMEFILACILCFLWKCLCDEYTFNLLSVLFCLGFHHHLTYFTIIVCLTLN